MSTIDPQLAYLMENNVAALRPSEAIGPLSITESIGEAFGASPGAVVLVEYEGDPAKLEEAGLKIRSVSGDVVTGVDLVVEPTWIAGSTAYAVYAFDDHGFPIEAESAFYFNGQAFSVPYIFAVCDLIYCRQNNL